MSGMLKWVQGSIAAVAGTAEPIYGREAFHPITDKVQGLNPYSEATADDFKWIVPDGTNVETQTFYFTNLESGHVGFAQVIHSNVMGVHTTAQFTFRIFNKEKPTECLWTSTKLEDFRTAGNNFYAKNFSIELNEENTVYTIKSHVCPESIVDLKITKISPSFKVGEDGTTWYGEGNDIKEAWGTMRHVFWPRNKCEGKIVLGFAKLDEDGQKIIHYDAQLDEEITEYNHTTIEFDNALCMFVMALQGMKPHHAAATWNFLNFQGPSVSAVQMEFTTPPSYGSTKVTIGVVVKDDKVLAGSIENKATHIDSERDDVGWPVPKAIEFDFKGPEVSYVKQDGDESYDPLSKDHLVETVVKGKLDTLVERVDVMSEIPMFVKKVVSGVAGAKPYIYQFCNEMEVTVKTPSGTMSEKGIAYSEATFISEL